jgi:hypothetical protein
MLDIIGPLKAGALWALNDPDAALVLIAVFLLTMVELSNSLSTLKRRPHS